ncbi:hypothetical protein N9T41_03695 [Candidatus Pelagibacter sp.]|nr:hypothetical protein [Candidatus Pelagibacter sp.]
MAMSKCRECGKAVSTLAKTCPSCGVPKPAKVLKKKTSTKKIIKKTENYKVEDWRDDPRFSGKRKKSSKKTEARNQWDELGWLDQDNHGSFEEYYKTIKVDKSIKSKTKEVVKKEESTQDSDWRKSLGLDYDDDKESRKPIENYEIKKNNIQHVIVDPWESVNPFYNPLYWILGFIFSIFWGIDGYSRDGALGVVVDIGAGLIGLAVMWLVAYGIFQFVSGVNNEMKINKNREKILAKNQEAEVKHEEITEVKSSTTSSDDNFIEDVFEGKKPLAETFWLYYVLANGLISFGAGYLADTNDNNIYLIAVLISNIWAGIGTWNSGTNYQLEKIKSGQPYGWAYGAKIMITLNFLTIAAQAILLFSL